MVQVTHMSLLMHNYYYYQQKRKEKKKRKRKQNKTICVFTCNSLVVRGMKCMLLDMPKPMYGM